MAIEQLRTASGALMEGPLLITPQVFGDDRGFFYESWNQRRFDEAVGVSVFFAQDTHSRSSRGVLRGLHYQLEQLAQPLEKSGYGTYLMQLLTTLHEG